MKRFLFIALLLVSGFTYAFAQQSGSCGDNLTWTLDENGTLTISGTGEMYDYIYYNGDRPWGEEITQLILEEGVTHIGAFAFFDCKELIGSLTLPDGLTSIGNSAFSSCGFTGTLTLPASLTSIGESAFSQTEFTGNLILPDGLTSIGNSAFNLCKGFTGPLTLPESLTSIGNSAFDRCYGFVGTLTLPKNLTSIKKRTFFACRGLTGDLTLPVSLTSIGESAFFGTGFTGNLILPADLTSIREGAFESCNGFTDTLMLPENLLSIGSSAFAGCDFSVVLNENKTPIVITADVFEYLILSDVKLFVPAGSGTAYSQAEVWKDFNIEEYEDLTLFHDFSKVDWDWSAEHKATLSLTCSRCPIRIKPTVSLSEELTKEATKEEAGLKTYTATATANKVTYKSTYREVLPRLTQPIHDTITITEVKTDTVTITVTDTIYIEVGTGNTVAVPMTVKLYPNPTNGSFTVETEEDAYLQIYNATGACIQSKQIQGGQFTGTLPSAGLYFIKLTSRNRTYTKRLMVK